jgi:uncharacterized protein YegL
MSGECLLECFKMFKISKPAGAGLVIALSCFLSLGGLVSRAEAMAAIMLLSPFQCMQPPPPPPVERLAAIADYDVIVFIDSSKSMGKTLSGETQWTPNPVAELPSGVPPNESRWQWCSEQTESLSKELRQALSEPVKDQFRVVLFNDRYKVFKDVDMASVPTFFASNRPAGNTNANDALRSQLHEYFAARAHSDHVKPLLVAMITDGCPDDPWALRQTIIDATKRMNDPGEIAITFLQVGVDPKATRYLRELDNNLVREKARYDIVTTKSFEELSKAGLAQALVDAVHR